MLVITRRLNEAVVIAGDIEIEIIQVKGKQVRLGITAARELTVHRKEVQDKIRKKAEAEAALTKEKVCE